MEGEDESSDYNKDLVEGKSERRKRCSGWPLNCPWLPLVPVGLEVKFLFLPLITADLSNTDMTPL